MAATDPDCALANVTALTVAAPACNKAKLQACNVLPVVKTSSTNNRFLPAN